MSNVFHMRSNDAVRQDVSLDSNFYAVIVVRQTDRQLQTIAIAQDLHDVCGLLITHMVIVVSSYNCST